MRDQQDMRVACALRLHQKLNVPAAQQIERSKYVFVDKRARRGSPRRAVPAQARCWYTDETGRHLLDAGYHPKPSPPDWVKKLDAR